MIDFLHIHKPTLILNEAVARRNIARMAQRARASGVRLRPHFKTHQSAAVGEWFRAEGVDAITVSSVDMAAYFAGHGWTDITIAFSLNVRQLAEIDRLAGAVRLHLLVESAAAVAALQAGLHAPAGVWLKIDAGYRRTGVPWDRTAEILSLAQAVAAAPALTLHGLLTHAGHAYHARGRAEIERVYAETVARLTAARAGLQAAGVAGLALSIGDTPGCSVVADMSQVDEIRPGNFVFYDLMQAQIGACAIGDMAVAVACPVVAVHADRRQLVLYGGAVHLSKEFIEADGRRVYGRLALPAADGWGAPLPGALVTALSQEHGVVDVNAATLATIQPGDVVLVLPVHACLTVNLFGEYHTLSGRRLEIARLQ